MAAIRVSASAKLNLFLHVTGKRADGYHLLESLVTFSEFGDVLNIEAAETITLAMTGPFAPALQSDNDNNLVVKAARLLQAYASTKAGARMSLEKHIPVGAGLGGGSADAAAALRGLIKLWDIDISPHDLHTIALRLGSDVPVCLAAQTAWMGGTGEQVALLPMAAQAWVVLANPGLPLLTADVFRCFKPPFAEACGKPHDLSSFAALFDYIKPKSNSLEPAALSLMPVIGEVIAALKVSDGCRLARMLGSGASCFGLYDNAESAKQAAANIKRRYPNWWCIDTVVPA